MHQQPFGAVFLYILSEFFFSIYQVIAKKILTKPAFIVI